MSQDLRFSSRVVFRRGECHVRQPGRVAIISFRDRSRMTQQGGKQEMSYMCVCMVPHFSGRSLSSLALVIMSSSAVRDAPLTLWERLQMVKDLLPLRMSSLQAFLPH